MPHPQTAAVFISTFPVADEKQIGERGREKASRANMKKAESEEERANVKGPTVKAWRYSTCSLDKEWEKKNLTGFLPLLPLVRLLWCAECNAFEHQQFRRSQRGAGWIAVELVASRGCAGELGERGQSRLWSARTRVESVGSRLIFTYVEGCKCATDEAAQHSTVGFIKALLLIKNKTFCLGSLRQNRRGLKKECEGQISASDAPDGILWLTCFMYPCWTNPHATLFTIILISLNSVFQSVNKLNCSTHFQRLMLKDKREVKSGWGDSSLQKVLKVYETGRLEFWHLKSSALKAC